MIDKKNLMNILIEYIQDVISFNDNKIDKSYIYKMIINPNYSTDNKLEEISEDNKIFDNWQRFFKYEKDIIIQKKDNYFILQSNDYREEYLDCAIKLYIPMNKDKIEIGVKKIFTYIKKEGIMHFSKIFKTIRNDNIIIRVFNLADVEKIIEFVNSNDFIKSGMMDLSPFVASKNGVGLAIDFDYSYHDILSNTIYKYFTKIVKENKNNDIDIDDYKKYMKSIVKNENNQKIKFIYNEIINNIDNYSTIDMILKYYNDNKLNIIKYLVYEIYNIYDYDKTLDIISDYDKLMDLDIDNKYLILVKKFISNNEYKKLTENKFKELLDDTIKLNTGYDTNELNDLLINKKNKLYNIINMTFKKNNCYQELLYYLNKYLNDINFDYKKTWLVNLDTFITKDDIKIIIRKVIKANEINRIVIEKFINIVLLSNNTKIENSIKEIFREAIINTYNNRSKNKDKFVRDAIKQYILINKINGFTNDNKHRDSVVKNISPYKSFYIISEYRNKDDDTLDNMIDKYVNNIISDIKK